MFSYITDINHNALDVLIYEMESAKTISLDIESNSLDPISGTLLLLQLKVKDKIYIFDTRKFGIKNIKYLLELINVCPAKVIIQNASFDVGFLRTKTGIMLKNIYCTLIAEAIISGGDNRYSSLDKLIAKYTKDNISLDKTIRDKFINLKKDQPITQDMLIYSAEDVQYLEEIYEKQLAIIEKEQMLKVLKLEMDLIPVVVTMISNGVLLDTEAWIKLYDKTLSLKEEAVLKIKETIFQTILNDINSLTITVDFDDKVWKNMSNKTHKFKALEFIYDGLDYGDVIKVDTAYRLFEYMLMPISSLRDIKELSQIPIENIDFIKDLFFERFNVDSTYQLRNGAKICGIIMESTAVDSLKSARSDPARTEKQNEFLDIILNLKKYSKRVSSFGPNFLERVHPETGRIHADVYQIGTVSGRFAYSNPNLQQIPGSEEYRKCFIAPWGKKIITSDWSQQELRLVGDLAEDKTIIEAYKNNEDIHKITAGVIYEIPLEEVKKEQRNQGKTLNFQTLYGATKWGIANKMGVSLSKAEEFIKKYYQKYSSIRMFKDVVEDIVIKELYSVTQLGRKRYFKIEDKLYNTATYEYDRLLERIKREGFNHPIQGGSADMLKVALINLHNNNPYGDKFKILMAIHDEIVVEVDEDIAEEAREFKIKTMNDAGNSFMEYISAETESNIANYWSK